MPRAKLNVKLPLNSEGQRTFAWLQNFRRLLVRQDRILTVYRGLFHFACLLITLRYL
jgi:transposase